MDNEETQAGLDDANSPGKRVKHRVLKPGESFGHFRVVRCLSAGLLANYYHMQHVRDLHDVTVGIFHPRTIKDSKCLKRLQALQKVFQSIHHDGIPVIRDCAQINERHCIFLDPIEGQTLSQYAAVNGAPGKAGIEPSKVAHLLAALLGVFGYAHAKGLDHRDLDSDLIFVKDDGSIRVLGLGIKAALGVDIFESIVSASVSPLVSNKTAGRLNSFDVMSPEYRSGIPEEPRVDLYAIGVIGYWLLTGKKPDPTDWRPPSTLVEGLPVKWDAFIQKCLNKDRDDRFPSCKVALFSLKETGHQTESDQAGYIQRQIDRIPVPKGILTRGKLTTRVYRLSVIGAVGLILAVLVSSFLQVVFTEPKEYKRYVAVLAGEGEVPNLKLHVRPPVAKVQFLRYANNSFIAYEGGLELKVKPGDYRLRVTAPHHLEQVLPVTVVKGEPTEYNIDLKPAWTDVQIQSEPGATISVVDDRGVEIELGLTDSEGIFSGRKGIFAGTYRIIVRKKGYAPSVLKNQEIAFGEVTRLEAPLVALPSSLTIRTQPEGARIVVNGLEVGVSPVTVDKVQPGERYLVAAQLEDYRSITRRIEIEPEGGDQVVVDFGVLEPRSGELAFKITFLGVDPDIVPSLIEKLKVELDGNLFPLESSELKTVSEGKHKLRLLHPSYMSELFEFQMEDREVETIEAVLEPRPGLVELVVPEGLEPKVQIEGQDVAVVDGLVRVPAKQSVELVLQIQNYLTMKRLFELKPNERIIWDVHPVAIPGPTPAQSWTLPYLGLKFVWVDPGSFTMGSPMEEPGRLPNEGPQTTVRFTRGFWMGMYEVTQSQYSEVMGENPSEFEGARHPVDSVTWREAKLYCEMLTSLEKSAGRLPEGYVYRLPTEPEWEYAARSGTNTAFSFGDKADASMGNFRGIYPPGSGSGLRVADNYGTLPVGSYLPNAKGLYDIHGNVREWTLDYYNGRLSGGSLGDPAPKGEGTVIAARGGSWEDFAVHVRSAARGGVRLEGRSNTMGFRVVLAPKY